MYYNDGYGFFCWVDEEDFTVFFHVPKMPYETLDIESLPMVYDPEEGYDFYDFNVGEYTPGDFIASSVFIRRDALVNMFGGADPVTLTMIEAVFNDPGMIGPEYDQGTVKGQSAGPYIVAGKDNAPPMLVSFSLYPDDTVISASVWLKDN